MENKKFYITDEKMHQYISYLKEEEHASATIEKYTRDIRNFKDFLNGSEVTKQAAIEWESQLFETHKKTSINAMLVAVNGFFKYYNVKISMKLLKIQRNTFIPKNKVLTTGDYERLIYAAQSQNDERLAFLIQTLGSTGIRVSELRFIIVEAVMDGKTKVSNKSKTRIVFITKDFKKLLLAYAKKHGITTGCIFVTKNGKVIDRSNIWRKIKRLSEVAKVEKNKLFPEIFCSPVL